MTSELELIRGSARDLLEARCTPQHVMALWDRGAFDDDLWRQVAAMGWAAVLVPEPLGQGLGVAAAVELLEQAGRVLAPLPLASSIAGAWLTAVVGAPEMSVRALASGEQRPALIHGEAEMLVRDGASATVILSIHRGRLHSVVASAEGVVVTPRVAAGRLREASVDVVRAKTTDLAAVDASTAARLRALRMTLEAAEISGACAKVLDLAVSHVLARHQFGRPLAAFQAVQHRMADMLTDLDSIRWLCRRTAAELDAGRDASGLADRLAVLTAQCSQRVIASGLQVHGGVGFIRDHPLHMYFGRQKAAELSFGRLDESRERVASALLDVGG